MIIAAPTLWLPPDRPAIVRAHDLSGVPAWQEMQRREHEQRREGVLVPFFVPAGRSYATWDPAKIGGTVTLSGGNLTATGGGSNWGQVLSTIPINAGTKTYVEWTINVISAANNFMCGVLTSTGVYSSGYFIGSTSDGWSWQVNVQKWHVSNTALTLGMAVNNVFQVAVDPSAGYIWFGRNNTWVSSGDPGAGTNPTFTGLAGTLYVAQSTYTGSDQQTVNFGASAFAYTPPTGFVGLYS